MNILEFALAKKMGGPGGEPINNQDKTITQNGTYTADEGFTGLGTVKVNVARDDQTDIAKQLDGIIDKSITEISSNVASIGRSAFSSCAALTTVNFPSATDIGNSAFSSCAALTTVNFPSATTIGQNSFYNCKALTTVNFPSATNIGNSAFDSCTALTAINFPSATTVGQYSFMKCTALTTADFPVADDIIYAAFQDCSKLTALILRSETMCDGGGAGVFTGTPIASGRGYIYIPRALVDSYKSATDWSTYATQFRALEDYTVDGTITGALDSTKI